MGRVLNFSKHGDGRRDKRRGVGGGGLGKRGWGQRGLIRLGLDCELAVSNVEMLQILQMIVKKMYRL